MNACCKFGVIKKGGLLGGGKSPDAVNLEPEAVLRSVFATVYLDLTIHNYHLNHTATSEWTVEVHL